MSLNLDLYKIFYITAKSKSFSKSASLLYTSQPAISKSIKQLEDRLESKLFNRNARGVSLTHEGEELLKYIEPGYSQMVNAERRFMELKKMNEGNLRISVCSAVCKYELLEAINEYNKMYPKIKINVKDEPSKEIARLLENGEIDIAILNIDKFDSKNMEIIKKIKVQDCFIAGSIFSDKLAEPLSLEKISNDYPIIMLQKGGSTREYVDSFFESKGINLIPQIELSNLDLILEFVLRGMGIACVAEEYVKKEIQKKLVFKIELEEGIPQRFLVAAVKKGMPFSTAAQKFIEIFCRETI